MGRPGMFGGLHIGDADLCCKGDNRGELHRGDAGSVRKGDAHSCRMEDDGWCRMGDNGMGATLRKGDAGLGRMGDDFGGLAKCAICEEDNLGARLGCCMEDSGKLEFGVETTSSGFEDEDKRGHGLCGDIGPGRSHLCSN